MPNAVAYLGYVHAPSGSQDFFGKYKITFSGNYTPVTGEPVNLLAASNPNGVELSGAVPMGTGAEVDVVAANTGGYQPVITNYSAGAFQLNFSSGGTELASGAYPAAISAGSVVIALPHRL